MPRGGHNKKPVTVHKVQGTYRADRHGRPAAGPAPLPRGTLPRPPRWLPPVARRVWRTLAPLLEDRGGVTEADAPALALACVHLALAQEAAAVLAKEGILTLDPDHPAGGEAATRKHPASQVLRDHSAAFAKYAERFGLTPAARKALGQAVEPPAPKSRFQLYLEEGRRLREAEAARRAEAADA